jgi:TetR/AcrR family transcriptional repressor of nem operon
MARSDHRPPSSARSARAVPRQARVSARAEQRIVLAAMQLFAQKGYGSTSVADILMAAEANPGSLYHYFPGKQDVLIAVLQLYLGGIHPMLLEPAWKGVDDPVERVFALLAAYRRALVSTHETYGCPIGSLALELHEPDEPVRKLLAANFDGWVKAIEACFVDAGARLPKSVDRHDLAIMALTTMEGGVMLARTARSIGPFDASVRMFLDYVNRLTTTSSSPRRSRSR